MAKVIVVTNFSSSSRNALEYTCKFLHNATTNVLLLNIFSFPGSITYNPIAIAAMGDTIADDERKLQNEYEWVRSNYPEINIHAEMVTGVFLEELYAKATEEEAVIIIVGAAGNHSADAGEALIGTNAARAAGSAKPQTPASALDARRE